VGQKIVTPSTTHTIRHLIQENHRPDVDNRFSKDEAGNTVLKSRSRGLAKSGKTIFYRATVGGLTGKQSLT